LEEMKATHASEIEETHQRWKEHHEGHVKELHEQHAAHIQELHDKHKAHTSNRKLGMSEAVDSKYIVYTSKLAYSEVIYDIV
jgi:hypothetical protein